MIQGTFRLGGETVAIIVDGNNLLFVDDSGSTTTIQGLRLNYDGVIKEHPDLEENEDWRLEAIKRLKEYIKKKSTEMEKINYVKDELNKFGYEPLFYQRAGHRPQKFR